MSEQNPPSPRDFKIKRYGIDRLPPSPSRIDRKLHAFDGNKIPRGDQSRNAVVDTGVLIALGAATTINALKIFAELYQDRVFTTEAVRDELRRRANMPGDTAQPAAKKAFQYLIQSGKIKVADIGSAAAVGAMLTRVHSQLKDFDAANSSNGEDLDPRKSYGEATLIVLAYQQEGTLLLCNDRGASLVADHQSPKIKCLSFADLLREMSCHQKGAINAAQAVQAFEDACAISGLHGSIKPQKPLTFFECAWSNANSQCQLCDQ